MQNYYLEFLKFTADAMKSDIQLNATSCNIAISLCESQLITPTSIYFPRDSDGRPLVPTLCGSLQVTAKYSVAMSKDHTWLGNFTVLVHLEMEISSP